MNQNRQRGLLALLLLGSLAWSKGNIEITNEAFQDVKEKKDGKEVTHTVAAKKVLPGADVMFVITYKNVGKESAADVVVNNPIPEHMIYKSVESTKNAVAEVSVDGGKSWGDLAKLKVTDQMQKTRPALAEDVTHVRWKIAKALKPNEEGKARFHAVLK